MRSSGPAPLPRVASCALPPFACPPCAYPGTSLATSLGRCFTVGQGAHGRHAVLGCVLYVPYFALLSSRATAACGCLCLAVIRLPALCLPRDVLGDILGTLLWGKVLMADTLHWIVAIWAEFATKTREFGYRIFHDIRGRQDAVGCGLESSTVRLPHGEPSLYPQPVVL